MPPPRHGGEKTIEFRAGIYRAVRAAGFYLNFPAGTMAKHRLGVDDRRRALATSGRRGGRRLEREALRGVVEGLFKEGQINGLGENSDCAGIFRMAGGRPGGNEDD